MTKIISIIIPMKDESESLSFLFDGLAPVLNTLPINFEIVIVNDGSTDNTLEQLLKYKETFKDKLIIIDLSRNFGKESALYAGFAHCNGDCAVSIDADLQDPPQLINEMLEHWLSGYEVVTAVREDRMDDTYLKRNTANLFYKLINKISNPKLIPNAGDFRLLDRKAINAFLSIHERVRFNKGLFSWLGFKEKLVYHKRNSRIAGSGKWNYFKLLRFSIDGITSFSAAPLKIWTIIGIVTALSGFLYAIYYFTKTIIFGIDVNGYPSLLIFILFFSGLQMIGLGVLGEYVGRIFMETKGRPLYIIRDIYK